MADKNFLDRTSILTQTHRQIEEVDVPEWGGVVRVRALTGSERDKFEASLQGAKTNDGKMNFSNFRAKLVVLAASDQNGDQLFGETDITQLGKTSAAALQRVFEVAQRLCGMTKADVEELTGNSESEPDSFSSDSL